LALVVLVCSIVWPMPVRADAVLAISPSPTRAYTGSHLRFLPSGGTGQGFAFTLAAAPSGGTITPEGDYTAGSYGGVVDVVDVVDSGGNKAEATIDVISTLAISGGSSTITIGGALALAPAGGSGTGYVWSLRSAPSGGSITALGAYTAGLLGGAKDVVVLTDSLANEAVLEIAVDSGLVLSPVAPHVVCGASIGFTAAGGSGLAYTYAITKNLSGATIQRFGVYAAGPKAGVVDVVEVRDGYGNTASANVSVDAIAVAPSAPKVAAGTAQGFVAAGGSGRGYAWSMVSAPSGGTINPFGIYTAGGLGGVTDVVLVVDSVGNASTVRVSVTSGMVITPATATVATSATLGFVVAGGLGPYTWSLSANPSGGEIARFGLYAAGPLGGATDVIEVRDARGNTATATVTVSGGPTITPATPSVGVGGAIAFVAADGSGGNYRWSLAKSPSGGTINAFGVYTAGLHGGVTDVVEVTDSLGATSTTKVAVASGLAIAPTSPIVYPGGKVSLTAYGGTGEGYRWSLTQNGSGAEINELGVYTAGFPDASANVTDAVRVVDSIGNAASVTITVLPIPADAGQAAGGLVVGASGEDGKSSGCAATGTAFSGGGAWLVVMVLVGLRRGRARGYVPSSKPSGSDGAAG
jgi:hypothetical protein